MCDRGFRMYELRWDTERNASPSCVAACEASSNCKRVLWWRGASHFEPRWPERAAHKLTCCSSVTHFAKFCIFPSQHIDRLAQFGTICCWRALSRPVPPAVLFNILFMSWHTWYNWVYLKLYNNRYHKSNSFNWKLTIGPTNVKAIACSTPIYHRHH